MCFVLADGGLYVDADDILVGDGWRAAFRNPSLKVHPLGYDLTRRAMVPEPELRQPDLRTDDRIFYLNNNPIAAPPGHPIIRMALLRATERLLGDDPDPEIQATTGPGNLTVAVAKYVRDSIANGTASELEFLLNWEEVAKPCWNLAYRSDSRNWRNVFPT
jgi:hypothetical protein